MLQRALCIYHPKDEVINLRLSSLYLDLHQRHGGDVRTYVLLSSPADKYKGLFLGSE